MSKEHPATRPRGGLLANKEMCQCGERKQYGKDYGSAEKSLFQSTACVETGAEVVSPESASERCSGALQKDCNHEENREDDLHIWQYRRDVHNGIVAKGTGPVKFAVSLMHSDQPDALSII